MTSHGPGEGAPGSTRAGPQPADSPPAVRAPRSLRPALRTRFRAAGSATVAAARRGPCSGLRQQVEVSAPSQRGAAGPVSWATAAAPRARPQLSPPGPGLTSLPPSARLPQRRVLRKSARGPREARRSESLPPGDAVARQPPPESALRPSPALGPGRSPSSGSPGPRREAPAQAGARSSGARGVRPRAGCGCGCGCDPVRV
ncbi:hypothetical protein VULLAG_LOCUS12455 [Vulpes lagopus]